MPRISAHAAHFGRCVVYPPALYALNVAGRGVQSDDHLLSFRSPSLFIAPPCSGTVRPPLKRSLYNTPLKQKGSTILGPLVITCLLQRLKALQGPIAPLTALKLRTHPVFSLPRTISIRYRPARPRLLLCSRRGWGYAPMATRLNHPARTEQWARKARGAPSTFARSLPDITRRWSNCEFPAPCAAGSRGRGLKAQRCWGFGGSFVRFVAPPAPKIQVSGARFPSPHSNQPSLEVASLSLASVSCCARRSNITASWSTFVLPCPLRLLVR